MAFNYIAENTKDYIKECLVLLEQSSAGNTATQPPAGNTATQPLPLPDNQNPPGLVPLFRNRGSGLPAYDPKKTPKATPNKQPVNYVSPNIDVSTLLGRSMIPGTVTGKTKSGVELRDDQRSMDYLTGIAQASSSLDMLDQILANVPSLKILVAGQLKGQKMPVSGFGKSQAGGGAGASTLKTQISNLPPGVSDLLTTVTDVIGSDEPQFKKNKLFQKTMEYSIATTPFEIGDPLAGIRRGLDMMGGKEIRKNIARMGPAQTRGAETTMGHPSGFGVF